MREKRSLQIGIDLKRIDELDLNDPVQIDELGRMVDDEYQSGQPYLQNLAHEWERNIRFFMGDQYLYFNDVRRRYEVVPTTKYNKFIPRPVTNLMLPIIQTMISIWTRQKPNASVSRNSTDPGDDNAAKLAERVQDAKWEIDEETEKHIRAALILCLAGTVARKDYWDSTAGPYSNVPGAEGKVGDNAVEIIDPFRIIKDLQTNSWIVEANVKPITWIKAQYGRTGDGYTGLAEKVMEDDGLSAVMELHQKLKTSISSGDTSSSKDSELKGCSVVKECYVAPTQKYPSGLMIVRSGGQTIYFGSSPYYDPNACDSWHPYNFCKYQELHFRWHGLPLATNMIKLQERLNAIDALIALARKTTAVPQKLKPVGCGVPEGYWTGQPGLEIPYNPVGASGAKPETIQASMISSDIWREREQVIQSMHWIAGDNEVLSGMRPEGVDTVGQMQMMLEQTFSKFNPFIQGWEKFIEKGQEKKLRLIGKRYVEPRPAFINRLKELNKDNLDVEIMDFVGSDLRDNVSVKIEAGSSLPRSKVVEQQTYGDLAKGGMFGPLDPIQNPVGNREFLEKFGATPINSELDADVKRAKWIVGILHQASRGEQVEIPPVLPFDNKMIHMKILTDRMKQPSFKDPMGIFEQRRMELEMMLQQEMMASQPPQVGNFPPPELGTERPSFLGAPPGAPIQ